MTTITNPMLLPPDVVLVPVAELPEHTRKQLTYDEGDVAITRPGSRAPSRIVDAAAAALLDEFRTAKTIIEAIVSYSRSSETDPEQALEQAFPMLQQFLAARILVPADAYDAESIIASFQPGEKIDGFEVLRSVQVLDDSELYQAKSAEGREAALKIARPSSVAGMEQAIAVESSILGHLDAKVSPRLLARGDFDGLPYLATEWCRGVYVTRAAEELRRLASASSQIEVLRLCRAILDGYAHLHAQNVIHSDVHPRNILVDRDNCVRIVDFGLAHRTDRQDADSGARGGVGFFFEPEYAAAIRREERPPQSTALGEQYAIAAVLYLLFTGRHYLAFLPEKQELMRQIAEGGMMGFEESGAPAWPAVETVLAKALSKEPGARFPSVASFGAALASVGAPTRLRDRVRSPGLDRSPLDVVFDRFLQKVAPDVLLLSGVAAPTCSVNYGAAGIAYALHRIAGIRGDADLLALADLWSARASATKHTAGAFTNEEMGISPGTVGDVSPYHSASGVRCVEALIAHARGDEFGHGEALDGFVLDASRPCQNIDLTLGRAGVLLACALLCDTTSDHVGLRDLADETVGALEEIVDGPHSILDTPQVSFLGIAHGWAGLLYALLLWARAGGSVNLAAVERRLRELASYAETTPHGSRWPLRQSQLQAREYMDGWCHGSAGYVFLWTLADDIFRNDNYLALAETAGWSAWEERRGGPSLCCGLAGQAYALLNLSRATGDAEWADRAKRLGQAAAAGIGSGSFPVDSLYKGEVGVALLAADLTSPQNAAMPFFEPERWAEVTRASVLTPNAAPPPRGRS